MAASGGHWVKAAGAGTAFVSAEGLTKRVTDPGELVGGWWEQYGMPRLRAGYTIPEPPKGASELVRQVYAGRYVTRNDGRLTAKDIRQLRAGVKAGNIVYWQGTFNDWRWQGGPVKVASRS